MNKTNYLISLNIFGDETIKAYRRRRKYMLMESNGKLIRLMEWAEWLDFQKAYPRWIKEDGIQLGSVWTLEEIKPKDTE
jgi:hypothetical protein